MPVLLFSQINQIAANHKCFVKFHVHGSVLGEEFEKDAKINARIQNVAELFSKLNLNLSESRLKYDFGFTFVWKKGYHIFFCYLFRFVKTKLKLKTFFIFKIFSK